MSDDEQRDAEIAEYISRFLREYTLPSVEDMMGLSPPVLALVEESLRRALYDGMLEKDGT